MLRIMLGHRLRARRERAGVTRDVAGDRILRFPRESAVPDVVYLEQLTSGLYLDERADVDDHLATMEMLCVQALPPQETRDALVAVRDELGR